jgi:hypothetical protein
MMSTPDHDFLDAAIQAKVAGIVRALPSPPAWVDDWNRLGPESSAEEILAVCQKVRDSGCLPADAGLHLVAGQIDAMIGDEAETSLRDLDDRMKAIERAYEQETGRPWPFDDIPPEYREYEELLRQYEAAWDAIFAARLETCGERDLAALYRADPKGFERRYEAGWKYFQEEEPKRRRKAAREICPGSADVRWPGRIARQGCPDLVEGRRPRSPDGLVQIASCLDVSRAELVRTALAGAGIAAALDNATFVSWYWHYANAVGGVKVFVCNRDFDRAREVLTAACAKPTESLPRWVCPACGQRVAGQWAACWQCGHWAEGTSDGPPTEDVAARPVAEDEGPIGKDLSGILAVATVFFMMAVLLKSGLGAILVIAPLAIVLLLVMQLFNPPPVWPAEPQAVAEPSDLRFPNFSRTRSEVSRAIVQRAWKAAIFALGFPPLGLYSVRLLWKLVNTDAPLSGPDRWRCGIALVVDIIAIVMCPLYCVLMFGLMLCVVLLSFVSMTAQEGP